MGPIASAAVRSGVMTIAVFLLFVAASIVMMEAPSEYRLRALQRSFTDIPILTTIGIGWLALFGWLRFDAGRQTPPHRSLLVRIGWAIVTTLLISAGIVALYECLNAVFRGGFWYFGAPWRYWLRLFEAAVFAVAVARIALPLLPRIDKMSPRYS